MLTAFVLTFASWQAVADRSTVPSIGFPGQLLAKHDDSLVFALDRPQVDELRAYEQLVLRDVPWGDGIELLLSRRSVPFAFGALHVDGLPVEDVLSSTASFWSGTVQGEESDAFLAFTGDAVWGWIQRPDELIHVLTEPNSMGDWSAGTSRWITERALRQSGLRFAPRCDTERLPFAAPPTRVPRMQPSIAGRAGPLRGLLAVETDHQFYQLFGDVTVAQGYVMALLAAANSRFEAQIETVLETTYLGFYTTPADPWTSQDMGGNCFDLLYEFQAAWMNGGAPVAADLHHFLSGANLGCGVAFLDALCDAEESFSLTSKMDGLTPFPVGISPLNWDFVWMCHELGHNFGSIHTHSFCPPLDECSPNGFFGPCQDEMACTTQGTFMSYCHACPGGMANFTTWFHPVVAEVMRAAVEASCFQPY